jgi:nucleoside-diphosphate-sugar epimerase
MVLTGLNPAISGVYNVSPSDTLSVQEVAKLVQKVLGSEKPIGWCGPSSNWKGDNPYVAVCNSKLKACGWSPMTSIEAVIQATKELGGVS